MSRLRAGVDMVGREGLPTRRRPRGQFAKRAGPRCASVRIFIPKLVVRYIGGRWPRFPPPHQHGAIATRPTGRSRAPRGRMAKVPTTTRTKAAQAADRQAAHAKPTKPSVLSRRLIALPLFLCGLGYIVPQYMQPPAGVESWLMFDGVCNLCDGFVNFVADGDGVPPANRVRFGAQQKHMELLERVGAPTDLSTLILIQGDRHYLYSTAALRTLAVMNYPWRGLAAFALVPAPLRDWVYKLIAAHRYRS